ncbi:acyl-CoA synthetase (AMP-forming)/AMP-acid ligase II [Pseudomonas sp. JAI111]|uniref:class I adenylate-forming enzyme family protein n=1 Tax=Pseudomonas sp. JAI111 TaxID=2735913 RepID=UPI0021694DC2|nr:fatty acid--CoA ligase family protein [Pseudomonas sp. JAI111]MCS3835702.1 acyl-CoA synthetase (AMP-forming)/AMP-acid ligase II [Pseudomonas sp. JAI111]
MSGIAEHIVDATKAGGLLTAIDFEGQTLSWQALNTAIGDLRELFVEAGLSRDAVIGLLGRNRLEQLGGFISTLGADRGLLLINAIRPVTLVVEEIAGLELGCLLGSRDDLVPEVVKAARSCGTMVIAAEVQEGCLVFERLAPLEATTFRLRGAGTLIEIQTSGTTGAPKRIPVSERTIASSLRDGVRSAKGTVDDFQLKPQSSPTLMFSPLVHTSGTFNTLMSVFEVRPLVLFEKFDAEQYRQALVKYRPKFVPLPPTAIKMMVDSAATREDFASVRAVRAGTASLPVQLQLAFEEKFGVPVLTTYGATEFMGVVTSWTLDDHKAYALSKRGSVGRVSKGVQLRIVDPDTREEIVNGGQGILEAKLDRIDGGREWITTTDLARVDADGFLYIVGRVDDAIIRGGFKVMAGKVAEVIKRYPGVYDAIVLGLPDERLGEVPVAVVEGYPGSELDGGAIRQFAKDNLTPYEVPVRVHVVTSLPRTVSDKISRPAVKELLSKIH